MRATAERIPRVALLVALLALLLWNSLYYMPYVVDDAFISLRYARNLLEGNGLVFNSGERIEGFSNFLWVLIGAAFMACGLPVLTALKLLGVLAGLAAAISTFLLGQVLFRERPGGSWAALLAAGLVCANTSLAVWTQAGLETALFTALIAGMCLSYETERRRGRSFPASALLFALLWLTRPEAPIYGLYFLVRRWQEREPLNRRDVSWLAALAAVIVPYEIWGWLYYGAFFPHTHAAKVGDVLERGLDRSQLYAFFFHQGWAFPVLCAIGLLGCVSRLRAVPAAAWAPFVSGVFFALYAWSDWMPRFRFMVPILPALFLLVACGVLELRERLGRRVALRLLGGLALAVLLVGYGWHQMFASYYREIPREAYQFPTEARGIEWFLEVPGNLQRRNWPLERMARIVLSLVPEGETVALPDIGFPGFLSMNPIWDLRGLVTPSAARFSSGDPAERQQALDDLFAQEPMFIVVLLDSSFEHFDPAIRGDPRAERYERIDNGNRIVLYLRRDRPENARERRIRAAAKAFPEWERAKQ